MLLLLLSGLHATLVVAVAVAAAAAAAAAPRAVGRSRCDLGTRSHRFYL